MRPFDRSVLQKESRQGIIFSVRKILMMACWLCIFCLLSCGMDTFYYLDPPISIEFIDEAESSSEDPSIHYVSFLTSSNADGSDIFQGTSVYYMIYNNPSLLLSDKTSIENLNENNSDQGMNRLIQWGYQALTTSQSSTVNLVPSSIGIAEVSIRLYNEDGNPAEVRIDGIDKGVPLRAFENKTFSFDENAQKDSIYSVPRGGESDVRFSAGYSTATWYVALYAVSTGMSPSLTPVYSQVTYLGSLAITPN